MYVGFKAIYFLTKIVLHYSEIPTLVYRGTCTWQKFSLNLGS